MPRRYPGIKVQVFVVHRTPRGWRFLALQRTATHAEQWHPVTGKSERGETVEQAAFRQVEEETGIADPLRLIDSGFVFEFDGPDGHWSERVFGLEATTGKITLSAEHQAYRWVTSDALLKLLHFKSQREGLRRLLPRLG